MTYTIEIRAVELRTKQKAIKVINVVTKSAREAHKMKEHFIKSFAISNFYQVLTSKVLKA